MTSRRQKMETKIKILIAEDNEGFLEMLSEIFGRNFEVYQAHNGKEAYDIFVHKRPTVVITDLIMPVMDGADLSKKVKILSPHTKVFAVSGAKNANIEGAKNAGIDEVFEKPGGLPSLYKTMNKLQVDN